MKIFVALIVLSLSMACRSRPPEEANKLNTAMAVPDMQGEKRENALTVLEDFLKLIKKSPTSTGIRTMKYPTTRLLQLFKLTGEELRTLEGAKLNQSDVECWSDNFKEPGIFCRFVLLAKPGRSSAYSKLSTVKGSPGLQIGEKGGLAYMITKLSHRAGVKNLQLPGGMDICHVEGFWIKKLGWLRLHSLYMYLYDSKRRNQAQPRSKESILNLNFKKQPPACFGDSSYSYRDSQRRFETF